GWERTFAVNVRGTFNTCQAFVPGMRERGWGRIVNIASIAGKDGNPNMSPYSASKAAVIALTKSLGKELATSGVLANAVAPAVAGPPDASAARMPRRVGSARATNTCSAIASTSGCGIEVFDQLAKLVGPALCVATECLLVCVVRQLREAGLDHGQPRAGVVRL